MDEYDQLMWGQVATKFKFVQEGLLKKTVLAKYNELKDIDVLLQNIIDNNIQLKEKGQSNGSGTTTALVAVSCSPEQQTSNEEQRIYEEVQNEAVISSSAATTEEKQPLADVVTSLGKRARETCTASVTPAATTTTTTDVASKRSHSNVVVSTATDLYSNSRNKNVDRPPPTSAPITATAQDADFTVAHIKLESAVANPHNRTRPVDIMNDGVLQEIGKQTSAGPVHSPSLPSPSVPAAGARARAAYKGTNAYTISELARLQELIPRFSAASTMGKKKMCKELTAAEFVSRPEKGLMCKLYILMKLEKERHTAAVAAQEKTHIVCNKTSNMSKPLMEHCVTSSSNDGKESIAVSSHEDRHFVRCTTTSNNNISTNNNSSSSSSSRDEETDSASLVSVSSISATLVSMAASTPSATIPPITTDWPRAGAIEVKEELFKDYGLDDTHLYYETDHTHCTSFSSSSNGSSSSDENSDAESVCMEETEEWEVSEVMGSESTSEPHPAITTVHITTITPTATPAVATTATPAAAISATPAAATTATTAAATTATPAAATTATPAVATTTTLAVATTTTLAAATTATPAAATTATPAVATTATPAVATTATPAVATTATPAVATTATTAVATTATTAVATTDTLAVATTTTPAATPAAATTATLAVATTITPAAATTATTARTFCVNAITTKQQYDGHRAVHTTHIPYNTFSIKQNLSMAAYMRKYSCTKVEAVDALRRKAFERGYII